MVGIRKALLRLTRSCRENALVSVCSFFDGLLRTAFDGLIVGDRSPDAIEHAVVLAAVKDAARR